MSWLEEMNRPVLTVGPVPHPEVQILQRRLMELFVQQRAYLAAKPTPFLEELLHQSEHQLTSVEFTARTAGEINRAACVLLLEARNGGRDEATP